MKALNSTNIDIKEKPIGTVTSDEGIFELTVNKQIFPFLILI